MATAIQLHHRGFEPEDVTALIEAHDWLSGLANRDCDCSWIKDGSQVHDPCDVCQARRAMDALNRAIEPRPITLHPGRLTNPSEKIYYELWCKENERKAWLNHGFTLIEHLLCPEGQKQPDTVSQRDMTIATSVIQWLGTNCGRCFIDKAEGEITKRNAERSEFGTQGFGHGAEAWKARQDEGEDFQVADSIASTFISSEKHRSAHDSLRMAILNAIVTFRKKERDAILVQISGKQTAEATA